MVFLECGTWILMCTVKEKKKFKKRRPWLLLGMVEEVYCG